MSKIFIYGFGPYAEFQTNITSNIVKKLHDAPGVVTEVFETCFDDNMFLSKLETIKPKFIIGLGQNRKSDNLYIERIAKNWRCENSNDAGSLILKDGPVNLDLSLAIPSTEGCVLSNDAGSYVCNYSMWIMQNWCNQYGGKFGFIHIPFDYNEDKATLYIRELIKNLAVY